MRPYAKNIMSPMECWSVFFTDEMLGVIVENTNLYNSKLEYARERRARPTTISEIKALLGLLYLAGTLKSNRLNTKDLWVRTRLGVERFWLVSPVIVFNFY